MCRSMVDIHSATAQIRRGKKKEETTGKNVMSASAMQGDHNKLCHTDAVIAGKGVHWQPILGEFISVSLPECSQVLISVDHPSTYLMAALPNIGGALCSMPQSLADADYHSGMQ